MPRSIGYKIRSVLRGALLAFLSAHAPLSGAQTPPSDDDDIFLLLIPTLAGSQRTTLTSSANPASFGNNLAFTATVKGRNPTGTVSLTDNGVSLGGCAALHLAASGDGKTATAACTTNSLSVGTHLVVAQYSGDASNRPRKSSPLSQNIAAALPGAPAANAAVAGNTTATISFTAPAFNGGAAITVYTASCTGAGKTRTAQGNGSPIQVTGLVNEQTYSCSVTATNPIGTGPASNAIAVTPYATTAPGAPIIGVASAGNGNVSLAFLPPLFDGHSPVQWYTATCDAGLDFNPRRSGSLSPIIVPELHNGTTYSCTVTATNAIGTGPASASVSVTPSATPGAVPGAPTIGAALPGNASARIAFTPPADDGGNTIHSYRIACSAGGSTITATVSGSPALIGGLINNTSYSCSVRAINSAGMGAASSSVGVTPYAGAILPPIAAPSAPVLLNGTPGNSQALLFFAPPADSGGATLLGYTATCQTRGSTVSANGTGAPLIVSGLTNGKTYRCTVKATNSGGDSPASYPFDVTPRAPGAC